MSSYYSIELMMTTAYYHHGAVTLANDMVVGVNDADLREIQGSLGGKCDGHASVHAARTCSLALSDCAMLDLSGSSATNCSLQ
jgi:hypothetical protein